MQFEHPETLNALRRSLRMLARKDHSESQLRSDLSEYIDAASIEECIEFLVSHRLIDDFRLARHQVEMNRGRNAKGDAAVRFKLVSRGFSENLVEDVLSEFGGSELERAKELVAGRFGEEYDRIKVARFLNSRGYTQETIYSILGEFY
jgi:SOS response regulatory protein OraA/RecX